MNELRKRFIFTGGIRLKFYQTTLRNNCHFSGFGIGKNRRGFHCSIALSRSSLNDENTERLIRDKFRERLSDAEASWSDTLLLPKTSFPLRANAAKRETQIMQRAGIDHIYNWQWNNLKHNNISSESTQEQQPEQQQQLNQNDNVLIDDNSSDVWVTHDGPPYANGDLHMGHALNKILKDIVNRYQILNGKRVHFVPGWDCHGLPIELKAIASTNNKTKTNNKKTTSTNDSDNDNKNKNNNTNAYNENDDISDEQKTFALQLRARAREFALQQVDTQKAEFRRWAVMADWSAPYLTLQSDYVASQLRVFGQMHKRGIVYRGVKPVYWSPVSHTALAEAELEYTDDHKSTAVFIGVSVLRHSAALAQCVREASDACGTARPDVRLALWTTTPWTLPANEAVCVAKHVEYALVAGLSSNALLVVAKTRLEALCSALGTSIDDVRIVGALKGSELAGSTYRHPLRSDDNDDNNNHNNNNSINSNNDVDAQCASTSDACIAATERRECQVFVASHVTDDSGTGLVHTAPGHGLDDWALMMQSAPDVPAYCPVDGEGRYDASVYPPTLRGQSVLGDGQRSVLQLIESNGTLLAASKHVHRYPYDWRARKPVIVRATSQWFVSQASLRDAAERALGDVQIVPSAGRARLTATLSARDDWCMSRQRVWGVPLPVFYWRESGEALLDGDIVEHVARVVEQHGSDAWWQLPLRELLPETWRDKADELRRGTDTMDVWFDSGTSWSGALAPRGVQRASDLVLEGSDQHRGWFQSSLLTSVAARDTAPYRRVLTHGFVLDERGRKMSKSLGNIVAPRSIVDGSGRASPAYGADTLRLWAATVDSRTDVSIGPQSLVAVSASMRRLRNTLRFLLAAVNGVEQSDHVSTEQLSSPLDRYALHRVAVTLRDARAAFDRFDFAHVPRTAHHLAAIDLSACYLDIIKDRLYADSPQSLSRRSAQTVCHHALQALLSMLAPILPHTSEEVWQFLHGRHDAPVHDDALQAAAESFLASSGGWPHHIETYQLSERDVARWELLMSFRDAVNGALEEQRAQKTIGKSVEADVVVSGASEALIDALQWLGTEESAALCIVSNVTLDTSSANNSSSSLAVTVTPAKHKRCVRCWRFVVHQQHAIALCHRCQTVLLEN